MVSREESQALMIMDASLRRNFPAQTAADNAPFCRVIVERNGGTERKS